MSKHGIPVVILTLLVSLQAGAATRPNVLFLISDDMNCRIGCYGDPVAKTPNLDRLAKMGVRFERAYCQQPLCNCTRSSVLSGRYPTSTGVLDNNTWLVMPDGQKTLPRHFAANGYESVEFGKIWHGPNDGSPQAITKMAAAVKRRKGRTPPSWFTPEQRAEQQVSQPDYWEKVHSPYRNDPPDPARYAWANEFGPLAPGEKERDMKIADDAVEQLKKFASDRSKPFFLSVGFHKPHVPLKCPKEFFDLYDAYSLPLPPDFATHPTGPNDTPPDELRQNIDLFAARDFTPAEARAALQAYYACVSYMDAQVGRVLDALEQNGLARDTIIVFWGDHGWHLSEKGMWAKGTTFEIAARGPMIIADPRLKATAGRTSRRVTQYLDMFPTLVDLTGIARADWLEGVSLRPLLKDPDAAWDQPAFTVQPRHWFIGRSIRTERWRFTEWDEGRRGSMLFDHDADPHETRNLAADPAHKAVLARLRKQLRESRVGRAMRRP